MAKAGRFEEAMKVAEGIEDAEERSEALREIAKAMAEAGMVEEAVKVFEETVKVAEATGNAWARPRELGEIAKAMAKAGMVEKAVEMAVRIQNAGIRSEALREIAEAMAKAGMLEEAKNAFEEAMELARQSADLRRMWEVAQTAAGSGFSDLAVSFAQSIAGERERLRGVLDSLVEVGAKGAFLGLLPFCGWMVATALAACAGLIRLYPDQAQGVAKVVESMAR
jgi:tetratricopeptide (TPR) repeat protein